MRSLTFSSSLCVLAVFGALIAGVVAQEVTVSPTDTTTMEASSSDVTPAPTSNATEGNNPTNVETSSNVPTMATTKGTSKVPEIMHSSETEATTVASGQTNTRPGTSIKDVNTPTTAKPQGGGAMTTQACISLIVLSVLPVIMQS